jgi:hypothetical protein
MAQTKSQFDKPQFDDATGRPGADDVLEDNILEGELQGAQSIASVEEVMRERVAQRAYEIYERRVSDGTEGDEVGDWARAEEEVRRELGGQPSAEDQS